MIRHVTLLKFKPEVPAADRERVAAAARDLDRQITIGCNLVAGPDLTHAERSYDLAVVGDFADLDGVRRYAEHPAHQAFAASVHDLVTSIVSVDFDPALP